MSPPLMACEDSPSRSGPRKNWTRITASPPASLDPSCMCMWWKPVRYQCSNRHRPPDHSCRPPPFLTSVECPPESLMKNWSPVTVPSHVSSAWHPPPHRKQGPVRGREGSAQGYLGE